MEAVVSLAMTEWRRPGYEGVAAVGDVGTGRDTGTENVAEAARSPGARSRTRSSSVSGPGPSTDPLAGAPSGPRPAGAFRAGPFLGSGSAP